MIHKIAMVAAIVLPFWNIPLVARVIKRKSSEDISISWALGVWVCMALLAPSAFVSTDLVWKVFSIANLTLFTFVVVIVLAYRRKR